jgi:putative hydrolase
LKVAADLHCHTVASGHAYSTVEEVIRAASAAGLDAVAITDHGPNMPGNLPNWYFENMKVIPHAVLGVEVFRGIEANIINDAGSLDAGADMMKNLNFIVASCHTVTISGPDADYYTSACVNAMKNPRVNVLGHPDDGRMPLHYADIVHAAAETHTLLEVNNHSLSHFAPRLNARENLKEMLKYCRKLDVPVVLSSDAHVSFAVAHFENCIALIKELEFPKELIANSSLDKLKSFLRLKGWKE